MTAHAAQKVMSTRGAFPVQQIIGNARVISICAGSSYGYLTGCHTVKMYIRARLCKVYILSGIRSAEMIVIIAHQLSGSRCLQWPYRLINTTIIDIAGGCFLIGVFILDRIFIGSDILWKRIHINPVFRFRLDLKGLCYGSAVVSLKLHRYLISANIFSSLGI